MTFGQKQLRRWRPLLLGLILLGGLGACTAPSPRPSPTSSPLTYPAPYYPAPARPTSVAP